MSSPITSIAANGKRVTITPFHVLVGRDARDTWAGRGRRGRRPFCPARPLWEGLGRRGARPRVAHQRRPCRALVVGVSWAGGDPGAPCVGSRRGAQDARPHFVDWVGAVDGRLDRRGRCVAHGLTAQPRGIEGGLHDCAGSTASAAACVDDGVFVAAEETFVEGDPPAEAHAAADVGAAKSRGRLKTAPTTARTWPSGGRAASSAACRAPSAGSRPQPRRRSFPASSSASPG